MSDRSAIQWTDATWNPVTGCTKVSPGCAKCYIDRTPAFRIAGRTFVDGVIPVQLHHSRLEQPLHWKAPRRVFVNSLSDLFHEDVPIDFIAQVFAVMALTPRHTYQVLTKRPQRMLDVLKNETGHWYHAGRTFPWPLPNVWLGVSVENQRFADERIPLLLQTPAAVRFISAEPLLESVDLFAFMKTNMRDECLAILNRLDSTDKSTAGLDWVIVGGESGPGARRFNVAWARSIVRQCRDAKVPCFMKQLGANVETRNDDGFEGDGDPKSWPQDTVVKALTTENWQGDPVRVVLTHKGGDLEQWPHDLRIREFPSPTPSL